MRSRRLPLAIVRLSWLLAALLLLGPSARRAAAERFEDITVAAQPPPSWEGTSVDSISGYYEIRVTVENLSKTQDHQVTLTFPGAVNHFVSGGLEQDSRTVKIAHGSSGTVSIFVPPVDCYGNYLAVDIDGYRQSAFVNLPQSFGSGSRYRGYSSGSNDARRPMVVLASRDIPQELKDDLRREHADVIAFLRSEVSTSAWSSKWLGYTCYGAVLLTDKEAAVLPSEVAEALQRYAEAGGIVLIHSNVKDLSKVVPAALRGHWQQTVDVNEGLYRVGFGLVGRSPTDWENGILRGGKAEVMPSSNRLKVVDKVTVPVRGLLLLVTMFAVGIGPVNIWMLARRHKKMWLWWNVPAVSVVTCLLIFAYSLFSDGLAYRGRLVAMTLLDENSHRATTLGYVSYYCPLTPSGLHFSYDTQVTPLAQTDEQNGYSGERNGPSLFMDWTTDQHLKSGWVVARVPTVFSVLKNETRRERLPVREGADGSVTIVNGLGVKIDEIAYMGRNGEIYRGSNLEAGKETTLSPAEKPPGSSLKTRTDPQRSLSSRVLVALRSHFVGDWGQFLESMSSYPDNFLLPGRYVAVVRTNPFLENPLDSASYEGNWGIIYGICAESEDGR